MEWRSTDWGRATLTGASASGSGQAPNYFVLGRASSAPSSQRSPAAALGDVVPVSAIGIARNVAAGGVNALCALLAGCFPEFGEPHLRFASGAAPFCAHF